MKKAFSFFFAFMLFVSFSELAFSQKQLPVKITPVDKNAPGKLSSVNQNIVTIGNNNDNSLINQTVLPGNGSTSGNGRAPQGSRRFVNIKYVKSKICFTSITPKGISRTGILEKPILRHRAGCPAGQAGRLFYPGRRSPSGESIC